MFKPLFWVSICVCLTFVNNAESAIVSEVSPNVEAIAGGYEYSYQLSNFETSTHSLGGFRLQILSEPLNPIGPQGWQYEYDTTSGVIAWLSNDALFDVYPGGSAEFKVTSLLPPGEAAFGVLGFDLDTGDFNIVDGTTTGPVAVPEPGTLVGFAIGAIVLLFIGRGYSVARR